MLRTFDDIYETMPWDAVDAVVFDVGQVLLSYNPQEILDEHVPDRPDLHPILLEKIFRSPYWLMRDHGLMTRDEAIEAMIGRDELLRPYITRVMHNWVDLKKVLPEGLKTLQSCKAHGKKVYVLSNYADDAFAVVEHKYDFFNLFDAKFVSGRLKLMKPSEQISSTSFPPRDTSRRACCFWMTRQGTSRVRSSAAGSRCACRIPAS